MDLLKKIYIFGFLCVSGCLSAEAPSLNVKLYQIPTIEAEESQIADNTDISQPSSDTDFQYDTNPAEESGYREGVFQYREPLKNTGFKFSAEYLLWKPIEDNLEYAVKNEKRASSTDPNSVPPFLAQDANGRFQFASLDLSSGFRFGAGYAFKHDIMQLSADYTFFRSTGKDTAYKPDNIHLYLQGTFRENTSGPVIKASTNIKLYLNGLNLRISKRFQPSDNILTQIYVGINSAWFWQKWHIAYLGLTETINHIANNWTFQGAGPSLGLNLDWHLGKGISFFGLFSGALVLGRYEFTYRAHNDAHSQFPTGVANYNENRVIPNLQSILGFKYGRFFRNWGFEFNAGYEINSWFNIFRLPITNYINYDSENYDTYRDGTLSFQGLTTGFDLIF